VGSSQLDEKSIFNIARKIVAPEVRSDYLKQSCGDDQGLRDRVSDLLRIHDEAQSFLESPPPGLAATVASPSITERAGQTIGCYKLLEEIGDGGMGVVYMAEQREPVRRRVALKIIKPGMDTREVIARFEAERQALALMDHPNIAQVLEAGVTESGRPYFVMELVNGVPLTDYCDQNRLTSRERLELFVQVCRAIEHAHQKGIIHRDIKPSNVMVTLYDGAPVPKVIDFGVAKSVFGQLTEKTLFTHHGQMLGTPLYMSPEQAEMSGRDVDTRSDVYSLGVMLYELLTGGTPFDRERVRELAYDELRRMVREDDPPRPSDRISTLGAAATVISGQRQTDPARLSQLLRRDLDWIVMKAIQKDRTQRYQTASDFERDIERYLADEPIEARPPTLADRAAKWARRHRPLVWSAVVLLALGTIGSTISTLLIAGAYEEKNQQLTATEKAEKLAKEQEGLAKKQAALAREQQQLAIAQEKQATQQRDAAQRNLYLADMRMAIQDWKAGQTVRLLETLDSHLPQPGQADLRGWEWYYLLSLCHGDLLTLRGHEGWVVQVAWSPNGEQLASINNDQTINISNDRTIKIWDTKTGREIRTLKGHADAVTSVVWSPDGRVLASGSADTTVRLWDAATGRIVGTLRNSTSIRGVAWSPDGSLLGTISDDQTVGIWDMAKRQKVRSLPVGVRRWLKWNPDSRRLAVGSNDDIAIWDATTGEKIRTLRGRMPNSSGAWSPDGRRLASGAFDARPDGSFEAIIWDVTTGEEVLPLKGLGGSVFDMAWSPDGRQLATTSMTTVTISDAATGVEIRTFRGHTEAVWAVAWSPDGKRLASGSQDGTIRIWDAARDPDARILRSEHAIFAVAWSPDGRNLATSGVPANVTADFAQLWSPDERNLATSGGETVAVWDMATGKVIHLLNGHAGGAFGVAWSPDGKRLASGDAQGTVTIWETGTGRRLLDLKGHSGVILALAWKPDGHCLASGSGDKTIKIWDAGTWKNIQTLCGHTGTVAGLAWSPNGHHLFSTQDSYPWGLAWVWDAATGQQLFCLGANCGRGGVASSPDGRWLALAPGSCGIDVWNATEGKIAFHLRGHTGLVFPVAWHPEGNRLASAAEDRTIKIWDTEARQEVVTLSGHTAQGPSALAWSPNGRCLAAPNGKDVKIWDASIGYELAASAEYRFDRAHRLRTQCRFDEALPIFQRLAADFPDRPRYRLALAWAFCARGRAALDAGDHARALPDFDQAIRLRPEYTEAYVDRGLAYMNKGDSDKAIADLTEAIRLDPEYARAYKERAEVFDKKGAHDKAVADRTEFGRLNPYVAAGSYNNRGLAYDHKGEYDKAIADYTEAIRIDPNLAALHNNRGLAYDHKGEYDKAIENYTEAIRLDPKIAAPYANRGIAYKFKNEYDKAIADFTEFIRLEPKNAGAYNIRGVAYCGKGEYDKAVADCTEAIRLDPTFAVGYNTRGFVYNGKDEYDKAIADCTEAIRLDPKLANPHAHRGWAYMNKGEYDKAIADCNEAIRLVQAGAEAHLEEPHEIRSALEAEVAMVLAEVHWRLAHKDLARRWYDKAVVWMDKNKAEAERLRRIRAEAAKLLGISEKQ